ILKAERTAINFLGLLSGVATRTREMVEAVKGTGARILDTRKTIPLHRYLEKYAVTVGGGENHRIGLWDMVLMKDNHIRAYLGGKAGKASSDVIGEMVKKARRVVQKNIKVEIEVETLKECETALGVKPDIIMLDNMPPETVKKAVELRRSMGLEGKVLFEVSGGITIDNVKSYAETGVDVISSGSLTSSVRTSDFSLEVILKDGKVPAGNRP
ncbi:MAG: carboxylating nicotinate-nucleotide diphosphorylase, partial [Candidatus Omnitrophica bacterium]|nr:carboxylating nicotinate-nucleotide diphosphorylase [Candidatus Omnitrophota bacterium]